jgi:hypothetical protein
MPLGSANMAAKKEERKKREKENDRTHIESNSTLLTQFSSAFDVSGQKRPI